MPNMHGFSFGKHYNQMSAVEWKCFQSTVKQYFLIAVGDAQ